LISGLFLILGSCATLPKNFDATPSYAVEPDNSTSLGQILSPSLKAHPGKSGFLLLDSAKAAFLTRIALTEMAEKSIDAQYFIWKGDTAGIILMDRLRQAADRGVRVRLLLDDITTHGRDLRFAVWNSHPSIEIRIFNPLGRRFSSRLFRNLSMAFHSGRMTHRMHNKIFAVDNLVAIVGGRNIADAYFGLDKKTNYRDMDLLSAGPVAVETSSLFDDYWNSSWSIPLEEVGIKAPSKKRLKKKYKRFEKAFKRELALFPYPLDFEKKTALARLEEIRSNFIWAEAEAVGDPPGKAWDPAPEGESPSRVVSRLREITQETTTEALIVSPYLILSQGDIKEMGNRVREGVRLKILTNSMMSTDALAVVAHYKGIRKDLIEEGIALFETRPDAANRDRYTARPDLKTRHSLHAKVTVLDRKVVFIGTYNIDPRSEHLNTEVGLLVHSPELGEQVARLIEEDLLPVNSWRLELTKRKKVLWIGEKEGKEIRFKSDPYAGFWKRFFAGFLSILPIKGQL